MYRITIETPDGDVQHVCTCRSESLDRMLRRMGALALPGERCVYKRVG